MPFTLAHPIAVAPLLRMRALDATALIIGSMAPDLEYVARGQIPGDKFGHTVLGLFLWCVPATLVVAWFFHTVVTPWLALRATRFLDDDWPRVGLAALVASALIGAATHLVFDAMTHADGVILVHIPAIAAHAHELHLWSSVLGVLALAIFVVHSAHSPPRGRARPRRV